MAGGIRLKTVPSRHTTAQLRHLLTDGARPAGPPTILTAPVQPGGPIEADRTVNANGAIVLADRAICIGYHLAGQRIAARLDHGVLHILDTDRTPLRSLPNPLTPAELTRLRGARPAGPPPPPATKPVQVQRRVSCRGTLMVAGQRIHVGIGHAGRTLTVEDADTTWRIYHGTDQLLEVARTSTKPIARFKARKPSRRANAREPRPVIQAGLMNVPTTLIGCTVDRTTFDYQVRLDVSALDPDEGYRVDAELVIETPFLLCDAAGEWHELDPGTGAALAPALDLFRRTISTVEIRGKGALHLTFDDGAHLHIGPHAQYESWHLTGTGVDPITVGPGGHTDWQPPSNPGQSPSRYPKPPDS